MNFYSIEYFLFVPLVFLCLTLAPKRLTWLVLLAGSCYFYLTLKHLPLLLVLSLVIGFSYLGGLALGRTGVAGNVRPFSGARSAQIFWC